MITAQNATPSSRRSTKWPIGMSLPACDPVQIGVEQPDRPDALAAERGDGGLGIVTVGHAVNASWSGLSRAPSRACA